MRRAREKVELPGGGGVVEGCQFCDLLRSGQNSTQN